MNQAVHNPSFSSLIFKYCEKYQEYLFSKYPADLELIRLVKEVNPEAWNDYFKYRQLIDPALIRNIANPFFIGYGNPDSEILIIGKELGFDPQSEYQQFYRESMINITLWKNILDGNIGEQEFNPRRPYEMSQKSGHTWSWYKKLVNGLLASHGSEANASDHFLDHCFITEFSWIPGKASHGRKSINTEVLDQRLEMLQHPFFQSFKFVINTARAYDIHRRTEDVLFPDSRLVSSIPETNGNRKNRIKSFFYTRNDQKIVLTSQLSGRVWTNEKLYELIKMLK